MGGARCIWQCISQSVMICACTIRVVDADAYGVCIWGVRALRAPMVYVTGDRLLDTSAQHRLRAFCDRGAERLRARVPCTCHALPCTWTRTWTQTWIWTWAWTWTWTWTHGHVLINGFTHPPEVDHVLPLPGLRKSLGTLYIYTRLHAIKYFTLYLCLRVSSVLLVQKTRARGASSSTRALSSHRSSPNEPRVFHV